MNSEKLIIFDTTLRDGEQCPGASMNLKEKLEIARQLALLKVDVIEAGFPVASPGDFESVRQIAQEIRGAKIAGLARSLEKDIVACAQALETAESPRIHIFLSTSKVHRDHKLQRSKEEIVEMAHNAVRIGKKYCDDIEFSPEDASRTERDFLVEVVQSVIEAGATTINIPDTVGYTVPDEFTELILHLRKNVRDMDKAVLSVHCHNDLGMAVANSLAAVKAGARQVECTINGIGERAGNAAMEEIVMALKTRKEFFGIDTGIDTKQIVPCSRLVSSLTGFLVQRNKAIVGKNAFAHESGVHQDGFLKNKSTYEIMNPEDVGLEQSDLVLGKHSGRNALNSKIKSMGYTLTEEKLNSVFTGFKKLADEKKEVFDEDLISLIHKETLKDEDLNTYSLEAIRSEFETGRTPRSSVTLKSRDGEVHCAEAEGDGPVDSMYNAVDKITGLTCKLLDYQVLSKTRGKDAQGEVTVRVHHANREVLGKGIALNTLEASALAYVNAVNKLLVNPKGGPVDPGEIPGP